MIQREIVTLSGRVQAVGFRDTVLRIAQRHPVAGTVRNLREHDRIELDVEGAPEVIAAFIDDVLSNRPPTARVDAVVRKRAAPRGATRFDLAETP